MRIYVVAQAELFVASESYFSTFVAVTAPSVKIVPMSSSATFFERKLCNGMGLCAIDDPLTVRDDEIHPELLERLLLEEVALQRAAVFTNSEH